MNIILYNLSGYKQPPSIMSVVRLLYMQYRSVTEKLKKKIVIVFVSKFIFWAFPFLALVTLSVGTYLNSSSDQL